VHLETFPYDKFGGAERHVETNSNW